MKTCSSCAPFSQLRVILGPSLTSPEWRSFERSGITGLKIQINFLTPIWDMQVGSRALVMVRHSFAHLDQFRIGLGLILVNSERRWFLKRTILHLQIWNHIWIPIWELYTWSWLRAKTCNSRSPFYQLRAFLVPSLTSLEWRLFRRSGIMGWLWLTSNEYEFWKENFFIWKYEIIFEYPFESCTRRPDCGRRCVVLGPLFLNFRSF